MAAADQVGLPPEGLASCGVLGTYDGGRVCVRNTFLDLDDEVRMPELVRMKTAPAKMDGGLDSSDEEEPEESLQPSEEEPEVSLQRTESPASPPPPMQSLYRTVTCDGWEDNTSWNWSGDDPNDPDSPEATQSAPPPTPSTQPNGTDGPAPMAAMQPMVFPAGAMPAPAGYILMPGPGMQQLPPNCIGFGTMQGMPPGCQAIPMDAYSRWPHQSIAPTGWVGGTAEPISSTGNGPASSASAPAPSGGYNASPAPAPAPQAAVLERAMSVSSGKYRVNWTVDARKLKGNDKVSVSPQFEISFQGVNVPFKMLIHPKVTGETKGGGSFRKAKGWGKIEVKCEGALDADVGAVINYRLGIGSSAKTGETVKREPYRGPIRHNFSQSGVCSLPKGTDEWNFSEVVDEDTQTFVVTLEIIPGA